MKTRGILLCGGRSRRMGRPKQWLPWRGTTLLAHLAAELAGACDEVVVIANDSADRKQIEGIGLRVLGDSFPGQGPLAGLHAGLTGLQEDDAALLLGCDLPFFRAGLALHLLKILRGADPRADAVVPADEEHLYPVCAAYRGGVRAVAEACLRRDENRMRAFLGQLQGIYVSTGRWGDEFPSPFCNMNTPQEYLAALNLMKEEG